MVWSDGCEKLLLQIARDRLGHYFEALTDRPMPAAPLEFEPTFPLTGALSSIVVAMIDLWRRDLDHGDGLLVRGVTGAHMSEALMAALLLHQPHTYSIALKQPPAAIVPRHVRRAEELSAS